MLHFVWKDLYLVRHVSIYCLYFYLFVVFRNPRDIVFIAAISSFLAFILAMSALGFDEKNRLEALYCSLPLKRSLIVQARYLSSGLLIAGAIMLSFLTGLILQGKGLTFQMAFFFFFCQSFLFAILFPLYYRFGLQPLEEIGKLVLVLIGIAAASAAVYLLLNSLGISFFSTPHIIIYLLLFLLAFVYLSLRLSMAIFKRRDF